MPRELIEILISHKGTSTKFGNPGWKALFKEWRPHFALPATAMNTKYSPEHYQRGIIEVWDFIADQQLDYFSGNVVKYLCRAGYRAYEDELDDLRKAKAYISKRIEILNKSRNH